MQKNSQIFTTKNPHQFHLEEILTSNNSVAVCDRLTGKLDTNVLNVSGNVPTRVTDILFWLSVGGR